jgi:hypothetical protein
MAQTFTALPAHRSDRILCYYTNLTRSLQIIRITNVAGWRFERLIFPGQRLLFESTPKALLSIYSGTGVSSGPLDQIPCHQLQVHEKVSP